MIKKKKQGNIQEQKIQNDETIALWCFQFYKEKIVIMADGHDTC
jgi:hypothetical protein